MQCNIHCHDDMNQTRCKEDPVCAQVMAYCEHGWTLIKTENPAMREFYQVRDELSVEQGLLLCTGIANCDTKPTSCRDPREDTHVSFGHSQMQRDRPTERACLARLQT